MCAQGGGVVRVERSGFLLVMQSVFRRNAAFSGGAIYVAEGGRVGLISNSTFSGNSDSGGYFGNSYGGEDIYLEYKSFLRIFDVDPNIKIGRQGQSNVDVAATRALTADVDACQPGKAFLQPENIPWWRHGHQQKDIWVDSGICVSCKHPVVRVSSPPITNPCSHPTHRPRGNLSK